MQLGPCGPAVPARNRTGLGLGLEWDIWISVLVDLLGLPFFLVAAAAALFFLVFWPLMVFFFKRLPSCVLGDFKVYSFVILCL